MLSPICSEHFKNIFNRSSPLVEASNRIEWHESRTQSPLTSYGACSTKTKALERTGSENPQIADLYIVLYYVSDNHSGSPKNWSFPKPSFSSSMRRKNLAVSRNEIGVAFSTPFYWLPMLSAGDCYASYLLAANQPANQPTNQPTNASLLDQSLFPIKYIFNANPDRDPHSPARLRRDVMLDKVRSELRENYTGEVFIQ